MPPAPADAPRLANAALEAGENLGRAMVRGRRKGEGRGALRVLARCDGRESVTLLNIISRNSVVVSVVSRDSSELFS